MTYSPSRTTLIPALLLLGVSITGFGPALQAAGILRVTDLNTAQIRALDRARTVVLLPGGMLEEHGPYLPAFTDGILSENLTKAVADAAVKTGWTVLVFPQMPAGASGSNELGRRFSFPGTYAIRPSTLRTLYMDLATELGDQGFRWIFVIHVHGAPWHNHVLDQAGDYFQSTYSGGRMVNLWGLVPVLSAWGKAMQTMTPEEKKEDGVSLHAGMDETSLMLHLRPELVAPGYATATPVSGATLEGAMDTAVNTKDWPGYLGSPRIATAAWGRRIWEALAGSAAEHASKILNGADPKQFVRYADLLQKNPWYQHWIRLALQRDQDLDAKQREWLRSQPPFASAPPAQK